MNKIMNKICSLETLKKAFLQGARKNSRPGPDGVTWMEVNQNLNYFLSNLKKDLLNKSYQPSIPAIESKPYAKKIITYNILNVRDRILEYAIKGVLSSLYEEIFLPFSCAYRPGKREKYFYELIEIAKSKGYSHYISLDIKSFLNSIDLAILENDLIEFTQEPDLVSLIKECLFIEDKKKGLPFGHILSLFFSNVYLHPIDFKLMDMKVIRYADNYIFYSNSYYNLDGYIRVLESLIKQRHLTLNISKTRKFYRPDPKELLV